MARSRLTCVALYPALSAALLLPFFLETPGFAPLLAVTALLTMLATAEAVMAVVGSRSPRRPTPRSDTLVAALAGLGWACLPVLLFPSAEPQGRLLLLAAMIAAPVGTLATNAGRNRAAAFILPVVAGGVWAVLFFGGDAGPVLAALQIGVGVLALGRRSAQGRPDQHRAPLVPEDRLVDLLLEGHDSAAGDWRWSCDEHLRLHGELGAFAQAAGIGLDGMAMTALFDPALPGVAHLHEAIVSHASFKDLVVEFHRADGIAAWWRLSGTPLQDVRGGFAGYRGVGCDVTALRQAQARIAFLATHDPLTGLANRETFHEEVIRACAAAARGGPVQALLLIDIDRFARVNDTLGHAIGDDLLAAVAQRLTRSVPRHATLARLGGDEFAILFTPETVRAAEALAVSLVATMAKPFDLGGTNVRIAASIGIAFAPTHAVEARALARKADLALLRAKAVSNGKPVVFIDAFEQERDERLRLEADLKLAIERHEFSVFYQPLLDVASGEIGACEALLRWTSPTRGMVSPAAFIPVAEASGLIVAIGRYVLEQACRDAATWPRPARVAVNISPQHLVEPSFKTDVMDALRAGGLPPSRLEIEITEGIFLDKSSASLDAVFWLRERGIKVALDDFGTGFSSLSYLVSFPVDKIKIDRSFVSGLLESPQSAAVIDAILLLARTLGLRVVAEGVETVEQALALKLRRCDDLQGYLISKAQPSDEIARLLLSLPKTLRLKAPALLESSLAAALAMRRSA